MLKSAKLYGRGGNWRAAIVLLGIILAVLGSYLLGGNKFAKRLDYMAQDALFSRMPASKRATGPPQIITILIGQRSLEDANQWPWPRSKYTELFQLLDEAALVVFDIVMPELSTPDEDAALAEAVRSHGRVITAIYASENNDIITPYQGLLKASLNYGVTNALQDSDGVIRRTKMFWQGNNLDPPSLPLAVLSSFSGAEPHLREQGNGYVLEWQNPAEGKPTLPPVLLDSDMAARFAPSETQGIPVCEYVDVLKPSFQRKVFKNAIVIIGSLGGGTHDLHRVPSRHRESDRIPVPGVSLVSHAVSGLFSGQTINDAPTLSWSLALLLMAIASAMVGSKVQIRKSLPIIIVILLVWAFAWGILFWHWHTVIPLVLPCAVLLLCFFATTALRIRSMERGREASNMPLDELLMAPSSSSRALADKEFGAYLEDVWPKINKLCGLLLLKARAGAEDADVAACLNLAQSPTKESPAHGLLLIQNFSNKYPRHRMLIPLPFPELEEYTLSAWDGPLNKDALKSAAALVVSIAMQYTIIEEQERRQNMLVATIQAISGAIDAKDPVTAGHSQRVAELSRDLATWLEWSKDAADAIFFSGILHDVGKIGVPDSVLNKAGKLSDEEFASMKSHPAKGHAIMLPIGTTTHIMRGILEHHERLDGKGYPNGLVADEISDFAKILKIADVYDALVSKRQYKDPWPPEKACDLLYSQRGNEFDPDMVDVFLRHMAPEGWTPPQDNPE